MTPIQNLHSAIGTLTYSIASNGKQIQRQDASIFLDLLTSELLDKNYDFDLTQLLFEVMACDKIDSETTYNMAMKKIEINSYYLSPELKEKFIKVMEKTAVLFSSPTKEEIYLLSRFKKDIASLNNNSYYIIRNGKVLDSLNTPVAADNEHKKKKETDRNKLRLKEAQAIAHIGTWEIDFSTGEAYWSDEACRIYGLPLEENKQTFSSWLSYIHPDDIDFVTKIVKESEAFLQSSFFYYRIFRRDGTVRYLFTKNEFDFDVNGKPIGLYGITQDVTEQKLVEERKEFERSNLSSLINNTQDLMWSLDKNLRLITSNHAFDEMVEKMSGNEVKRGDQITNGFSEDQMIRWRNFYSRAFTGEIFTITEYADFPVEIWSEISFYPIRERNEIIGTACYSRDITERKKTEAEIQNLNGELEERVKLRTSELAETNALLRNETQIVISSSRIIEQKNKDITDSLNYAKIIQNAIIHKKETLEKLLPQSFILNMPYNIVSGDFVRVEEKKGKILLALADCTGHGIPGAMMSMIGCALFNDIINHKRKTDPSIILKLLDSTFTELTKQGTSINDGMDVGFCCIDLKNMELNYAGAHRPLYIIRDGCLIETNGDNISIGGSIDNEKKFTNHIHKLYKNDTIYMLSDGYTDQFGGEKGKKFSTKKFKEMILSIQHMNMQEQDDHMKKMIIEWKGDLEQIDDICVVGFRI